MAEQQPRISPAPCEARCGSRHLGAAGQTAGSLGPLRTGIEPHAALPPDEQLPPHRSTARQPHRPVRGGPQTGAVTAPSADRGLSRSVAVSKGTSRPGAGPGHAATGNGVRIRGGVLADDREGPAPIRRHGRQTVPGSNGRGRHPRTARRTGVRLRSSRVPGLPRRTADCRPGILPAARRAHGKPTVARRHPHVGLLVRCQPLHRGMPRARHAARLGPGSRLRGGQPADRAGTAFGAGQGAQLAANRRGDGGRADRIRGEGVLGSCGRAAAARPRRTPAGQP